MGRMLGMNERQLMAARLLASHCPGCSLAAHLGRLRVVGAVVGEYLGAAAGLGYLIQQAEGVFDVAGVFAGMFVLSGLRHLIDMAVTAVEKRLLCGGDGGAAGLGRVARNSCTIDQDCNAVRYALIVAGFVPISDVILAAWEEACDGSGTYPLAASLHICFRDGCYRNVIGKS